MRPAPGLRRRQAKTLALLSFEEELDHFRKYTFHFSLQIRGHTTGRVCACTKVAREVRPAAGDFALILPLPMVALIAIVRPVRF